jgi:hypothetical protein
VSNAGSSDTTISNVAERTMRLGST